MAGLLSLCYYNIVKDGLAICTIAMMLHAGICLTIHSQLQANDHQMQAAQRQIAAHVKDVSTLQAEQMKLAAVIQQQKEVIAKQSAQTGEDRETIASLEVCVHSAIEEMELMCSTSTSAMQSLRCGIWLQYLQSLQ